MMKRYIVGVFPEFSERSKKYRFSAYLRDYSSEWDGCIEIEVKALNGRDAKKIAIDQVKKMVLTS